AQAEAALLLCPLDLGALCVCRRVCPAEAYGPSWQKIGRARAEATELVAWLGEVGGRRLSLGPRKVARQFGQQFIGLASIISSPETGSNRFKGKQGVCLFPSRHKQYLLVARVVPRLVARAPVGGVHILRGEAFSRLHGL